MSIATESVTAEEFLALADDGPPRELVRGRIVEMMNQPNFEHGILCAAIAHRLQTYLDVNDLGQITSNDSGVVTERGPDTVRGPDVAFFSYARMPRSSRRSKQYPAAPPEIAIEVLSPSDEWKEILAKVAEYLMAGVLVVCVVDSREDEVRLYYPDRPERILRGNDAVDFPNILPGFSLSLAVLFAE